MSLSAGDAFAARTLLADLLAHQPAGASKPAMSSLALEACLRRASELDRTGIALDTHVAEIDRLTAEGIFLERQLESEMPMLGGYDEARLKDYQARVIRHEAIAKNFSVSFRSTSSGRKTMTRRSPSSSTIARWDLAPPISPRSKPSWG